MPDGESFTIQFDVITRGADPDRPLALWIVKVAVPEPATIALLGSGGLVVLRNHR
ncbi:MAG: PEP-CTERM sorting domain-containing protein [Planctomycetes bacterium]|nr:PEP-CTERM sorting domain-containing protein [Planctomycetota bacterium]